MTDQEIRKSMEMAVEEMRKSQSERRNDKKETPKVGAVLVLPTGQVYCAHRGEFRSGEHAEYVLLDKKLFNVDVSGSTLFTTLEPCAPGARSLPKVSCAERIVDARISKVYVGLQDPDPTVASKGMAHIAKNGIDIVAFDQDLQEEIRKANVKFLVEAEERAKLAQSSSDNLNLSYLEKIHKTAKWEDLSIEAMSFTCDKLGISFSESKDGKFKEFLEKLQLIKIEGKNKLLLSNEAVLLFAKNPMQFLPQANIKVVKKNANGTSIFQEFNEPLVMIPAKFEDWYKTHMVTATDRSSMSRKNEYEFPFVPIREPFVNALVHRDYSIEGANVTVKIDFDKIEISSPGGPPSLLTIEQLENLNAPSFARNPKLVAIFSMLKIVEKIGYGMSEFSNLTVNYNLPSPIVSYDGVNLKFEFFKTFNSLDTYRRSAFDFLNTVHATLGEKIEGNQYDADILGSELRLGLEYIRKVGKVKTSEYAEHFKYSHKKASRQIKSLRDMDLIKLSDGCSPKSPNATYEIIRNHGQDIDN